MFYKLRDRFNRATYNFLCRSILATPPLVIKPAPLIVCSMVSQRDLIMYLVAIKSVYSQVGEGTIHIINDGSLTEAGIAELNRHLCMPTIIPIDTVETGPCPHGGCWERLLHILSLTEHAYVIQVDSDILARQSIPEVVQCYRQNRSFTLGTKAGQSVIDAVAAASFAAKSGGEHIQIVAERSLLRLDRAEERRYVRGCAGFAGFAKGTMARQKAEAFSREMQEIIGIRWSEWGTEQVTSNYLIANATDAFVLPWRGYASYYPEVLTNQANLLHFLGSYRFYRGKYIRESRRVISELSEGLPIR